MAPEAGAVLREDAALHVVALLAVEEEGSEARRGVHRGAARLVEEVAQGVRHEAVVEDTKDGSIRFANIATELWLWDTRGNGKCAHAQRQHGQTEHG